MNLKQQVVNFAAENINLMSKVPQQNSETSKIYIPAQPLADFVATNEVAWQMYDTNISFSREEGYEYIDENDRTSSEKFNKRMLDVLRNSKECVVFNPGTDDNTSFEDLIEWSEEKDLLILADDMLLLCVAPCDKEKVLAMAD